MENFNLNVDTLLFQESELREWKLPGDCTVNDKFKGKS